MNINISPIVPESVPTDPGKRLERRLGRHWPMTPLGSKAGVELFASSHSDPPSEIKKAVATGMNIITAGLDWLAKRPAKDRVVELDFTEIDKDPVPESVALEQLDRVAKLGIKRLRLTVPDHYSSVCLSRLGGVEYLHLDCWSAENFDLSALAKLQALQGLHLFGPYNNDRVVDLRVLANLPVLRQLSLQMHKIKLALPPSLEDLTIVKVTELACPKLSVKTFAFKHSGPELLANIASAEDVWIQLTARKFPTLPQLPTLMPAQTRRLVIDLGPYTAITSAKLIAKLSQLRSLYMTGNWKDLEALSKMASLEELGGWNGRGVIDASKMTALTKLDYTGNEVVVKGWPRAKTKASPARVKTTPASSRPSSKQRSTRA